MHAFSQLHLHRLCCDQFSAEYHLGTSQRVSAKRHGTGSQEFNTAQHSYKAAREQRRRARFWASMGSTW
jgi:hypothetical protein